MTKQKDKVDVLGDRMKDYYENRSRTYLTRRTPVIIRCDGKAFHTLTKSMTKPFDEGLIKMMQDTAIYMCENIQGCKAAYVQSDEISLLLTDYDKLTTDAWFDYNVQKITSISASLATGKFNQLRVLNTKDKGNAEWLLLKKTIADLPLAQFDSRCFNIPKEEVANYFIWRQQDAVRNSISMLAQSLYSPKELHGVNTNQMQELCFQKGHNWNDLDFSKKRGSFIVKNTYVNDKRIENKKEYVEGDLWYQPNSEQTFEHLKSPHKGRLLEYCLNKDTNELDWYDVKIEKIRTKWEVIETPNPFTYKDFEQWC